MCECVCVCVCIYRDRWPYDNVNQVPTSVHEEIIDRQAESRGDQANGLSDFFPCSSLLWLPTISSNNVDDDDKTSTRYTPGYLFYFIFSSAVSINIYNRTYLYSDPKPKKKSTLLSICTKRKRKREIGKFLKDHINEIEVAIYSYHSRTLSSSRACVGKGWYHC